MTSAVVIHGWEGLPEEGWRPWLRHELVDRGWRVEVPAMPNTKFPHQQSWVELLSRLVGKPNEQTFLVGHSLGATCILRYLEQLPKEEHVGGAVLVAGPTKNHRRLPQIQSFFSTPFDWPSIRYHFPKFVTILSDNDPYVPASAVEVYRQHLSGEVLILSGHKHFSHDDGFRELPVVLEKLLAMVST